MIFFWQVDINNWQVNIKIWQVDIIIWQVMTEICHHNVSYFVYHHTRKYFPNTEGCKIRPLFGAYCLCLYQATIAVTHDLGFCGHAASLSLLVRQARGTEDLF